MRYIIGELIRGIIENEVLKMKCCGNGVPYSLMYLLKLLLPYVLSCVFRASTVLEYLLIIMFRLHIKGQNNLLSFPYWE